MKKILFFAVLSGPILAHAQWTSSGANITTSSNVGIGTTVPSAKLQVVANEGINVKLYGNSGNFIGPELNLRRTSSQPWVGQSPAIQFGDDASNGGSMIQSYQGNLQFFTAATNWLEAMRILTNGNVGIGTSTPLAKLDVAGGINASQESHYFINSYADPAVGATYALKIGSNGIAVNGNSLFNDGIVIGSLTMPSGYKLAVNGSAIATSMTVKIKSAWPDYVFKKQYNLRPLSDVKQYINQHQHLPEVPSKRDIEQDGLNLGEMMKLQMRKIEELTLYLIEKDKEMKVLRKRLQKLEKTRR